MTATKAGSTWASAITGIEDGKPANRIVLDCSTDEEAVRHQADVLCSVHNGRTVFTRKPPTYTTTVDGFTDS